MNKSTSVFLIAALALVFSACRKNDGYVIKGQLTGIREGMVKLQSYDEDDRTSKVVDSVSFSKGSFRMEGKLPVPGMMTLIMEPGHWSLQLFLENSVIRVKADTAGSEHFDYSAYGGDMGAVLTDYSVSGSISHDDYQKFQKDPGNEKFKNTFADLNKKYEALKDPEQKEVMKLQFDSVRALSNSYQKNLIRKFVMANPSSVAGAYLFSQYYLFDSGMPLEELDSMLILFSGEAKSSPYFKSLVLNANMRKALLPGNTAPDFTLLQRDSLPFTLSSSRGGYVMLDFWASWCKPCRQAIPHWKVVYERYHSKGFEIISISDDSRWNDWIKAMDAEKMPWIQVIDEFPVKRMPARIGTLYMTHFIPFYVLLDKEGKILLYTDNESLIDQKLSELLL